MMRIATPLAYLVALLLATGGLASVPPTGAPTSAPTSAPEPEPEPTAAPTNAPAKPVAPVTPPTVPMAELSFSMVVQTPGTCGDMTTGTNLAAMKLVGSKMTGLKPAPPASAVAVTCSVARRLEEEERRLTATGKSFGFAVKVPQAKKAAAETSVKAATPASVATIFTEAKSESGAIVSMVVDQASIDAMVASVAVVDVAPSNSNTTTPGNTTTTTTAVAAASGALEVAPKCVAVLYALLWAALA
eukprot:TRINITY_DN26528_c0_g1_i1.p2 TRINITY_DN26528_c0_g1~~TRINITY_DN26528_c0_g1_i1.p2  ORF type:complete len:245 (-),score=51.49 TRINITY_DN26528_c0_g1_i1:425-1159(-)